jgi:hypothetical protein
MNTSKLCIWLRQNSAGIYRPAADAANEIEHLRAERDALSLELAAAREALETIRQNGESPNRWQWDCVVAKEALSTPAPAVSNIEAVLKSAEKFEPLWAHGYGYHIAAQSLADAVRNLRGEK